MMKRCLLRSNASRGSAFIYAALAGIEPDAAAPVQLDIHTLQNLYRVENLNPRSAHPRYHLHCTPTGASWLNLAER